MTCKDLCDISSQTKTGLIEGGGSVSGRTRMSRIKQNAVAARTCVSIGSLHDLFPNKYVLVDKLALMSCEGKLCRVTTISVYMLKARCVSKRAHDRWQRVFGRRPLMARRFPWWHRLSSSRRVRRSAVISTRVGLRPAINQQATLRRLHALRMAAWGRFCRLGIGKRRSGKSA